MTRQVRTYPADQRPEVEVWWDGEWVDADLRQWVQADDGSWTANVRVYVGGSSRVEVVGVERVREVPG